jgi:hypothetical protein
MTLRKQQLGLIALAPLVLVMFVNYPVLTLCVAWMVGMGYYVYRMRTPPPIRHVMEPGISARTEDVLPREAEEPPQMQGWWNYLWNNPNHGMMVLLCGLYIANPLDAVIPIVDDVFAFVLLVKHAHDWFREKWGVTPEKALVQNAQVIAQAPDVAAFSSALSPQGMPVKSPR